MEGLLDARVDAITTHIVQRLAAAAVEDMRARYDFGRVLLSVRQGKRGSGTLTVLADRLGVDPSALRRYARVSDTIPAREFAWLMRLRTVVGAPLTWSHVELLARERSVERRRALATAIAEEALSVRAAGKRLLQGR
jgi:hypothetical protein